MMITFTARVGTAELRVENNDQELVFFSSLSLHSHSSLWVYRLDIAKQRGTITAAVGSVIIL